MNTSSSSSMVYNDLSGLNSLKTQSREAPQEALGEVAKQFESLFVSMMMKAMRDTVPEGGMFDSGQMSTYQEMFDQQLSLDLASGQGLGMADLIERQLSYSTNRMVETEPNNETGSEVANLNSTAVNGNLRPW